MSFLNTIFRIKNIHVFSLTVLKRILVLRRTQHVNYNIVDTFTCFNAKSVNTAKIRLPKHFVLLALKKSLIQHVLPLWLTRFFFWWTNTALQDSFCVCTSRILTDCNFSYQGFFCVVKLVFLNVKEM